MENKELASKIEHLFNNSEYRKDSHELSSFKLFFNKTNNQIKIDLAVIFHYEIAELYNLLESYNRRMTIASHKDTPGITNILISE